MEYGEQLLKIYTDGASRGNPGPASYGFLLVFDDEGIVHEESGYIGKTTNNRAEYRAVINALEKAADFHDGNVEVYSDSQLLVRQMQGRWKVKSPEIKKLYDIAVERTEKFKNVEFKHVSRETEFVSRADSLCNQKLDEKGY